MMTEITNVRPSPIAGTWYSAYPDELQRNVDEYINKAVLPDLSGEVIALVAPHAGYRYSGSVAGYAFKAVAGQQFDYVAVLSPMHHYHTQPLLTSEHHAYRTPLGDIPIARKKLGEIGDALKAQAGLPLTPITNDNEHSLEIQLPFLQRVIKGNFELVPIMIRDQSPEVAKILGKVLADNLRGESFLMVASSDLSHFYPESKAKQLDQNVLSALLDFSPERLFELKDLGMGQACGLAAIAAILWAARKLGGTDVTLLNYDTSASTTDDYGSVVGYGAAAITRPI